MSRRPPLTDSWKDLANFACAEEVSEMNEFVESRIKRDLREIDSMVQTLSGNVAVAWWECLGTGKIQRKREMLNNLGELLIQVCCQYVSFNKSQTRI